MRVWDVPYQLQIRDAGGGKRSEGLHLTEITRDLALRGGILDKKYADNSTMSAERVELGIAWEERLAKHHPEIVFHPGEMIVDEVAMTMDGISYNDGDISIFHTDVIKKAIHEFKLTWKSSRRGIEDFWLWMTQTKSYIKGAQVTIDPDIFVSYVHVYWVNGNYSKNDDDPDNGPRYRIYGCEFSQLEIDENWSMIRNHKVRMLSGSQEMFKMRRQQ